LPPVILPEERTTSFSFALDAGVDVKDVNHLHAITSVYPMPFNEHFIVQIDSEITGKVPVVLYDLNGKVVLMQDLSLYTGTNKTLIQTNTVHPGTYFLEIGLNKNRTVQKIIKQ